MVKSLSNNQDIINIGGVSYWVTEGTKKHKKFSVLFPDPNHGIPEEYVWPGHNIRVCRNAPNCEIAISIMGETQTNLIPAPKGRGRPKAFCNTKCKNSYFNKLYRHTRVDHSKAGAALDSEKVMVRVYRPTHTYLGDKSHSKDKTTYQSVTRATSRWQAHVDSFCEYALYPSEYASIGRCPGRLNDKMWSQEKWSKNHEPGVWPGLCLMAAVLRDDIREAAWHQIHSEDQDISGVAGVRLSTTNSGRW